MAYDVFVSHASEDKDSLVRPLATLLARLGVRVWYDEFSLEVGDSLSRSIDRGLAESKFGVVVISPSFMSKPWPELELRGLTAKELGHDMVILLLWHGVTRDDVLEFSPMLADKLAIDTGRKNLNEIALSITRTVRPDILGILIRRKAWDDLKRNGKRELRPIKDLKIVPIRHETLPIGLLVRIKVVSYALRDAGVLSLDSMIDSFRRDLNPQHEVAHWEQIVAAFLEACVLMRLSPPQKKDAFVVLIGISVGVLNDDKAHEFEHLRCDQVMQIASCYANVVPRIVEIDHEAS